MNRGAGKGFWFFLVCTLWSLGLGAGSDQSIDVQIRQPSFDNIEQYNDFRTDQVETPVPPTYPSKRKSSDLTSVHGKQFKFDQYLNIWVPVFGALGERAYPATEIPEAFLHNLLAYDTLMTQSSVPSEHLTKIKNAVITDITDRLSKYRGGSVNLKPIELQEIISFIVNPNHDSLPPSFQPATALSAMPSIEVQSRIVYPDLVFSRQVGLTLSAMSSALRCFNQSSEQHPVLLLLWNASLKLLELYGAREEKFMKILRCHIQSRKLRVHSKDNYYWSKFGIPVGLARLLHGVLKSLVARIDEVSNSRALLCVSPTVIVSHDVKEGSLARALHNLGHMNNRFNTEIIPLSDLAPVKNAVLDALTAYINPPSQVITRVLESIVFQPYDETLIANFRHAYARDDQQRNLVDQVPVNCELEISAPVVLVLERMSVVFQKSFCWNWHGPVLSLFWNASLKLLELHGAKEDHIMRYLARDIQKNLEDRSQAGKPMKEHDEIGQYLRQNLVQTVQDIVYKLTTCMDSADVDSIQTVPDEKYGQKLHNQRKKSRSMP
uniref:Uncharacterized protein n=1 Tax=Spongospora subterranea TaxID=70186 RepID=A0A0H5QI55_9EUKA|eukprot:CRZ01292.1 hypothetical protein [Spongospora subterranea]